MKNLEKKKVDNIYSEVKSVLDEARNKAVSAVNRAMVLAYWNIGRIIVEHEQKGKAKADYGDSLMKELSRRLTKDFGKGFAKSNLFYMRKFYLKFPKLHALRVKSKKLNALRSESQKFHALRGKSQKVHAVSGQLQKHHALRDKLSWTHYRLLLRVDNEKAMEFYLDECVENNWSTRELDRQISTLFYERTCLGKKRVVKKGEAVKPEDFVRDPYILEFLNIREPYNENDLESLLVEKLKYFLLELGKGFSFVARQKRISIDGDHFYVDLVFYNYLLKCFVLIDLKIGKLSHRDIGQMDFYVRYFEKEVRTDTDNPTIGLILCSEKNEAMVKYTLLDDNVKKVFASKYKLYLPSEKELKREIRKERDLIETERNLSV